MQKEKVQKESVQRVENQKGRKEIMSHEKIYRIMQWLPIVVAGLFFLINAIKGNGEAVVAIGVILAAFVGVLVFVRVRKISLYVREFVVSMALPVLVFAISLYSGASYSDDFCLHLAVIAITGLYLEPKFTKVQIVFADILLVLMYLIHPEKAESQSQYILCMVVFTLAAVLDYLLIKRGRGFIEKSDDRAAESEHLLASIREMGDVLQRDFEESSALIAESTSEVQEGSATIARGAGEVSDSCNAALLKVQETEGQIECLNEGVKSFEVALTDNKRHMEAMKAQVHSVSEIITESAVVFRNMEEQMQNIAGIAKQINDISFKLTILSLNASVEAAQAGEYGAGFEVLATEMRALSESSGIFTDQVSDSVKEMRKSVAKTSERFSESEAAMQQSEAIMAELAASFGRLNSQFEALYGSIEQQNYSVAEMEQIFEKLNLKAADMHGSSLANREAVDGIAEAMSVYRESVGRLVENTRKI